jgi:hypothetical protein
MASDALLFGDDAPGATSGGSHQVRKTFSENSFRAGTISAKETFCGEMDGDRAFSPGEFYQARVGFI